MGNLFFKSIGLNSEKKLIDKLRHYQDVKSEPTLSKKSFKDLMNTFIEGYKRIPSAKNVK